MRDKKVCFSVEKFLSEDTRSKEHLETESTPCLTRATTKSSSRHLAPSAQWSVFSDQKDHSHSRMQNSTDWVCPHMDFSETPASIEEKADKHWKSIAKTVLDKDTTYLDTIVEKLKGPN